MKISFKSKKLRAQGRNYSLRLITITKGTNLLYPRTLKLGGHEICLREPINYSQYCSSLPKT